MAGEVKVSVIIPAYNAQLLIQRCIESVINQSGPFSKEIIVIDDGSNDLTGEIILKKFSEKVILLRQENQGPASARNLGSSKATGKYLAFLDADDYWDPDFLNQTVSFLETYDETIAVSAGQIHKQPGKDQRIIPELLTNSDELRTPVILEDFYRFWVENNHVCTGSILIRAEIVKITGGQRTDLRCAEDLEYWALLGSYGKIGFIPKLLFVSDGGDITRQRGWFNKNILRWKYSATPEDWEKRITVRMDFINKSSYELLKGKIISQNLVLPLIFSKRFRLAYNAIKCYKQIFPQNRFNKLLIKIQRLGLIPFYLLCVVLFIRGSFK